MKAPLLGWMPVCVCVLIRTRDSIHAGSIHSSRHDGGQGDTAWVDIYSDVKYSSPY